MEKVYKFKLDILYRSLIIYMVFFIIYAFISGDVFEKRFELLLNDPLIYILLLFNVIFIGFVVYYIILDRKIIIRDDNIIFKNRFGQRMVSGKDIQNVRIIKKRSSKDEEPYKIAKLRLKNRRRLLRIRTSDYENGKELIKEFLRINPAKQI